MVDPHSPADQKGRPFPPDNQDCELCQADRFTHWYAVTPTGWVADCEVCMPTHATTTGGPSGPADRFPDIAVLGLSGRLATDSRGLS